MATIVVDAGHGGTDPGAVNGMRRESADVLAMAVAVGRILECRGHRVIYTRQTDIFIPLNDRARISNNANADIFVSIHRNASVNTSAHGVENIIGINATNRELDWAQRVLNRILALNIFTNRGIIRGNFLVLNATTAPSQLLEIGFISNAGDNQRVDTNFSRIVTAIADGIEDCVGRGNGCLGGGGGGGTNPPITPQPPVSGLPGTVSTTGGNLNVRSAPNSGANVIGSLPNGSLVTIVGEQSGWLQILFQGTTGWISGQFVNINSTGTVTTSGGNLNMRAAPNASANVVASIPNGTRIPITGISGDFYQTTFNGINGFVSKNFVRF